MYAYSYDEDFEELSDDAIESFLTETGIDLSSNIFNFTINNLNSDSVPPRVDFKTPLQLKDGVLDIINGESSVIKFEGSIDIGKGSSLDNLYVELHNLESNKSIYLNIDDYQLDRDSSFDIFYDATWDRLSASLCKSVGSSG